MQTVFQSIQRNASRLTLAAFAATSMLMAGCASATTMISDASVPATLAHVSADVIYVRGFDVSASQVRVDDNVMHRVKAMATGDAGALSEDQTAVDARNAVADEIVGDLRAKGLHAERIDGPVPTDVNALIVEGRFDKIDEGKSRRRMLIGLGAGKSDVSTSVQVFYQPAHGTPVPVELFQTSANSGHMPGIAETAGIGAAAGALTTAAAAGAGVHGVTEMKRDSISAEARRVGDAVAKQVAGVVEKLSKTV
ncbi:uncharacterized protein DUF4410 [Cupriavidus metallidurans]|jgi:hypothetical protein|uniref:DUF4410 domain-containing protein n=1 Tax=Cupriavidus TaxID=106589 RepID=UPI0004937A23|nr:DUF4410 domain-containing protein [Cupriavidus metallidurans]AVA35049.1 DUF4410 domain-containing protein [Cupriavidus metallidurans]KWW34192.1 hypothetical protein AU374_04419 [Cupriavidus metallidurans]MDE4921364.1 DUF4410 domain-containing protein [Cupriavidus metallidurans]